MIDYQTFHQIRQLCDQEHLSIPQIAAALHLDERTVSKWIDCKTYQPRTPAQRASKLDPHKGAVVRLLAAMVDDGMEVTRGLNRRPGSTSAAWPSSWKRQRWNGLPIILYKVWVF